MMVHAKGKKDKWCPDQGQPESYKLIEVLKVIWIVLIVKHPEKVGQHSLIIG